MPLARFQVRNEYGLGAPEIYRAAEKDDPKAILDGVAVAGLVGILRQLGDLAEFAAEVFHDLQEQVLVTAARSHKMVVRVQHIEAALPPLEKAVLAQTSHIHFAYTTGSDWHANIRTEQNHLIYSDLPEFIVDSYEECRDPPRLHLLDKFDTDGPGACLKRYSDPSYFRRVLPTSESVHADKVQREKNARKSKKKGSRLRNGEVSHTGSISRHSGRMQFTSPNIYGQRSAAERISLFDVRSNSELGDHSTSFDSRTRSGFIECVFDGNSSLQSEKQEDNELPTSGLKMQSIDNLCSVLPDKQNGVADDDSPHGSLQEQSAPNSSSVTWDEKTEIVKPDIQPYDDIVDNQHEVSELHPMSPDPSKLEKEAAILGYAVSDDLLFVDENIPESVSGGDQVDEIGSEPDSYVDALNTMESETESDFECQTKREVDLPSSNFRNKGMECGAVAMHEMTSHNSDSSDVDSRTASCISSNKEMSQNFANLVSADGLSHAQPPQITGMSSSNPEGPSNTDLGENTDILNISRVNGFESALLDPPPSSIPNLQAPLGDKIVSSLCKSQESNDETSVSPSVKLWTNGGLLGLEPSKPPDCSLSNGPSQNSPTGTKNKSCDLSSHIVMPTSHFDGSVGKLDMLNKTPEHREKEPESVGGKHRSHDVIGPTADQLVRKIGDMSQTINQSKCSTSHNDKKNDDESRKNIHWESTVSDAKLEKSKNSHYSSGFSHSLRKCSIEGSDLNPGPELPVTSVVKAPFNEAGQKNIESSCSSMFDHGHRLLVNGFRRKASLVHGDESEPACSVENGLMKLQEPICNEQKKGQVRVAHRTSPETTPKKQLECDSPENSLSSSPPLEHMNISFHPINGFETSKLKLQFPDGRHFHESIKDVIFPSFQLLPEPTSPQRDIDSESDDDTFCRSSPCMSADLLSHHSESNSEPWESRETVESRDPEIYDAFHRVSSAESITSSLELEGISHGSFYPDYEFMTMDAENGINFFHSGPLHDIPSFAAVNPLRNQQETKIDSDPKDLLDSKLQYLNEPTPPLPPLPPLQWCIMKPSCDMVEVKQEAIYEAVNHPNDKQIPGSTTSQQPAPSPPKQPHIKEASACPPKNKDQQKFNGSREVVQAANAKEVDERGDLLHQIRTKSFSLKRTVPARPTLTQGPTTNIKVAAILEKANAIRQAVGSDEGGDDENWSDG